MFARNSKKKIFAACLGALLVFSLFPTLASTQTTFVVNTTADTVDNNIGDGVCADANGNCSLRAAIQESNALTGADMITLPAGTYNLTIAGANEENAATGDLDINDDLTLTGNGANTTFIDGGKLDRIFDIAPSAFGAPTPDIIVNLQGITVRNGEALGGGGIQYASSVLVEGSVIEDNVATFTGGGLASANNVFDDPRLTLRNVIVRRNRAPNFGGDGGGIDANFSTRLVIERSSIIDNHAEFSGGGIAAAVITEPAILTDVIVSGNTTGPSVLSNGGGISGTCMTIDRSTISNNRSGVNGGGMQLTGDCGTTITNSTLSGNEAGTVGGAIGNSGTITLTNVTIANNSAVDDGGGIFQFGFGSKTILRNTIIANNSPNNCGGLSITSEGHNLASDGTCSLNQPSDLPNTDPLLGPLANNGGPTQTRALLPGSPAIDAGDNAVCPSTDQRGVPRPQGAACDIGAYELETVIAPTDLSITKSDSPDPVTAGSDLTYTLTITNDGPGDATGVIVTDTLPVGVTLVSATPSQGSCSGSVTCDLGDLANGASATITIVVTVDLSTPSGTITNIASVTGNEPDPNTNDNTASEDTTVEMEGRNALTIDFEGLSRGAIVDSVSVGSGISVEPPNGTVSGSVSVKGINPRFAENAAMIFVSTAGGDDHLDGFEANKNLLIISEDLNPSEPDDNNGGTFEFDFSNFGPGEVSIRSLEVFDVDPDEPGGTIVVETADGSQFTTEIPVTGHRAKGTVSVLNAESVRRMTVTLKGSGAIDNIRFVVQEVDIRPSTITIVKDAQPNSRRNFRFTGDLGNFRLDDVIPSDNDGVSRSRTVEVKPGVYTVREAVPGRWLLADIRCDPATSSIVDLDNNQVTITVTGGNVTCTFINQIKGIIRVQKYNDRNADAQRTRGEPALADWTIRLYDDQQTLVDEQVTNRHGKVSFTSLRPGNYTVCEELTAGWVNTQPGLIDPAFSQPCYVLTLGVGQIAQVVFGNSDGLAASSVPSYDDGVFIFSMPDNETDDDNYDAVDTDEEYLNTPDEVSGIYLPLVTR